MTTETLSDQAMTITEQLAECEVKAWDSLAGYKFVMFGYWAGVWVHLNRIGVTMGYKKRPNPWRALVKTAKGVKAENKAAEKAAESGPGLKLFSP